MEAAAVDYLRIDRFLGTMVHARALASAFELGLIDALARDGPSTRDALRQRAGLDAQGLDLLVGLLSGNEVVTENDGAVRLSDPFAAALQYRDLLEAKLDFLEIVGPDVLLGFTDLVANPARFMAHARVFRLFDYRRAFEASAENVGWTRRWMRITTALTRYEAEPCLACHDFAPYRRMLDVGGNSGEFALRICARHPKITATILDLPLVCQIGREHVRGAPEAERIAFVAGDALRTAWPGDIDIVTFKSMLHDWPDPETAALLASARQALRPGGTLLIFERGPLPVRERSFPYALLPMLLFARSFRRPDDYRAHLEALGFHAITVREIGLEMPFMLVSARKPS